MNAWSDKLWNAFWYVVLPAVLAIALIQGLYNFGALEEPAPWQYLLAFAVLEIVVLTIRDRVIGSRADGRPRDFRTVSSEARDLQSEMQRLIKKGKPAQAIKDELEAASKELDNAISKRDGETTLAEMRRLDQLVEKHLGTVRKGTTREYIEAIAVAVLVALGIRAFVVEAFKIPTPSMYPTLNVGDNIFVNKFVYGPLIPFTQSRMFKGRLPKRGEVVVFRYPVDMSKDYIKRVIGLPGDSVRLLHDGTVEVNGSVLPRCELGPWHNDGGDGHQAGTPPPLFRAYVERNGEFNYVTLRIVDGKEQADPVHGLRAPYVVPPDHIFVMGDNRDDSYDSRYWGPVPVANIKGKALWIWWSNIPGAGCGMRWNRFGQDILGTPRVQDQLRSRYDTYMKQGTCEPLPAAEPPH